MTHTTVIQAHAAVYPHDNTPANLGKVRWYCETTGCTSLGGHWTTDLVKARRGAQAHRQRHNGGPKALQNILTLEW